MVMYFCVKHLKRSVLTLQTHVQYAPTSMSFATTYHSTESLTFVVILGFTMPVQTLTLYHRVNITQKSAHFFIVHVMMEAVEVVVVGLVVVTYARL